MSSLMIFAAGFGKRLHPLTLDVPKSLVPIQNIPVLDYILKSYYKKTSLSSVTAVNTHYKAEMIREFIRNTHYKAEMIREFIKDNPQYKISESFEEKKFWEQGKWLFYAQSLLQGENFWVQMQIFYVILNTKIMDFQITKPLLLR